MKNELTNKGVRKAAKSAGVRFWEMAEHLEVSECTLSNRFRHELPAAEKEEFFALIQQIAAEKEQAKATE